MNNEVFKKEKRKEKDFQLRVKDVFEKSSGGRGFINDVLPKLPKLANGMRLLGCNEHSQLIDCGEIFKMRAFLPHQPLQTSETWEDNCTIRLTNNSRLISDEHQIAKVKLEVAVIKTGLADEDAVGIDAVDRLYEVEDIANITLSAFMEQKVKGKQKLKTSYSKRFA